MKGRISAYYQDRGANFSGPGQLTPGDAVRQDGASVNVPLNATTQLAGKFDEHRFRPADHAQRRTRRRAQARRSLAGGIRHSHRRPQNVVPNASPILSQNGERTDAAVTVGYQPSPGKVAPVSACTVLGYAGAPADARTPRTPRPRPPGRRGMSMVSFRTPPCTPKPAPRTTARAWAAPTNLHRPRASGPRSPTAAWDSAGKLSTDYRIDDHSNVYLNYTLAADQPDALNVGRAGHADQRHPLPLRRLRPAYTGRADADRHRTGQSDARLWRRFHAQQAMDLRLEIRARHDLRSARRRHLADRGRRHAAVLEGPDQIRRRARMAGQRLVGEPRLHRAGRTLRVRRAAPPLRRQGRRRRRLRPSHCPASLRCRSALPGPC